MGKLSTAVITALLAGLMLVGGCAPRVGGNDYDASTVRTPQNVAYGTVADVRVVRINDDSGTNEAIGTVGGGVVGGVLGNMIDMTVKPRFGGLITADEVCLPVTAGGVLPCGASGRWQRA